MTNTFLIKTAASHKRMLVLSDVKTRLGVTVATFDTELTELILEVGSKVESVLGYAPWRQEYTEYLTPQGAQIWLRALPVETISQIVFDGSVVDSVDYRIQDPSVGTVFNESGWIFTPHYEGDLVRTPMDGPGRELHQVDYYAGWVMPEDAASGVQVELPRDLKRAAYRLLTFYFEESDLSGVIAKEQYGNASISYGSGEGTGSGATLGMPNAVFNALLPYIRMA